MVKREIKIAEPETKEIHFDKIRRRKREAQIRGEIMMVIKKVGK